MSLFKICWKSSTSKLAIALYFGVIYFTGHIIFQTYWYSLKYYQTTEEGKLLAIAKTAALQIDTDQHKFLSSNYAYKDNIDKNTASSEPAYLELHHTLKKIQETNQLQTPVYTLVYDTASSQFEFIGTSSDNPYYRHTYKIFPKKLLLNQKEGESLGIHESENGKWISAFAPVKDKNNKVIALLQVDKNFDEFYIKARKELYIHGSVSLLFIIPITSFLIFFVRKSIRKEERIKNTLQEQNEEIQTQNENIERVNKQLEDALVIIEQKNKELNLRVKDRTRELLKANKDLGAFLYRSSHDIQGPLRTLEGITNIMKSEGKEFEGYTLMIKKNVSILMNRVKSVNRIYEIKMKELKSRVTNGQEIKKEIICRFKSHKEYFDFSFSFLSDFVVADHELLLLSLEELIDNALKYTSEIKPKIKISLKSHGCFLHFLIDDNGNGISPEHQKRIFNMFERLNENSQGSGLGLYCVKLATKRLSGNVELLKSNSSGSLFRITLPFQTPSRKAGNFSRYAAKSEKSIIA